MDCVQAEPEPKSGKLRCEACRQNNKKCGDDRPCRYCREADLECVENGRRKGGPGVRMKRVRVFFDLGLCNTQVPSRHVLTAGKNPRRMLRSRVRY